jgi:DNA gyrase/topoisomerase IV subunit A
MDQDERHREELMILEALVQAMDRRDEVFQVIEDSEDVDEAIRRVGQLLGVGTMGSRAVLDLQARRFTRGQRQASAFRAEELRSMLPDGR